MSDVTSELWRFLAHFGPYGQGNPRPVFLARDVGLSSAPQIVGGDHLRLRLDVGDGATPDAIAFGQAAECEWLTESSRVDIAFQLGLREWQGVEHVQAQVIDVRPSEAAWASSGS
jgi:single-stranded-DNA-specific exonuclease